MEPSTRARDAFVRFCDRLSAGDVAAFDDVVATDAKLVIGTAPGEWVEDRDRMRFGFETEGVRLEPDAPQGYEEGSMAWVVDQPTFGFPDDSSIKVRCTAVLRREDEQWRIVHAHFSVGVPDDQAVALQAQCGA